MAESLDIASMTCFDSIMSSMCLDDVSSSSSSMLIYHGNWTYAANLCQNVSFDCFFLFCLLSDSIGRDEREMHA